MPLPLVEVQRRFIDFSNLPTHDIPPLYTRLSTFIASRDDLLDLAAGVIDGQPPPNMLFAAVHDLLLAGVDHPLRRYYGSVTPDPVPAGPETGPIFREFCQMHQGEIRHRVANRRTQTNEIGRSALLLPAFAFSVRQFPENNFHLVELGCSAGLNLNWPFYGYDYGHGGIFPPAPDAPMLKTELRGSATPPLSSPQELSRAMAMRTGIELYPLEPRDPVDIRWLKALTWPDQPARMQRLDSAARIASLHPPHIHAGELTELLPHILSETPDSLIPLIYHSFVFYQLADASRKKVLEIIAEESGSRPVLRVYIEWTGQETPTLNWEYWKDGKAASRVLGTCHPHGAWLEWR